MNTNWMADVKGIQQEKATSQFKASVLKGLHYCNYIHILYQ